MITSRQVMKIIKDELKKDLDESAQSALRRLKDKIEILEEIEYVNMYKQPVQASKQSKEAYDAAEKLFSK